MKLVICDDELQQLTAAKKLIEEISAKYCVPVKVQAFTDLQECWQQLEQEPADIIILDIFMGEDLGTDFALKLRQRYGDAFALVFLTGSNEFASESYAAHADYYLLKPVNREKMLTALRQCRFFEQQQYLRLSDGRHQLQLNVEQIIAVEVQDKKCHIYLEHEEHEVSISLGRLVEMLPEGRFWQVHRSYVINPHYIEDLQEHDFIMRGGLTVPIRRSGYTDIKRRYMQWLFAAMAGRRE